MRVANARGLLLALAREVLRQMGSPHHSLVVRINVEGRREVVVFAWHAGEDLPAVPEESAGHAGTRQANGRAHESTAALFGRPAGRDDSLNGAPGRDPDKSPTGHDEKTASIPDCCPPWMLFISPQEEAILRCLAGRQLSSDQIATEAGYGYNDRLKGVLTNLVDRHALQGSNKGYQILKQAPEPAESN